MPTPVGHVLGGLTAAFLVSSAATSPRLTVPVLAACAAVAVAPDLDIPFGSHRTYTHSIAAVAMAGITAWVVLRRRLASVQMALAIVAAHGSHLVLDWMGTDTSRPPGLMMLWPVSSDFYVSGWNVFAEVSRRYWRPEEFLFGNMLALMREFAIIMPVLLIAWTVWSKRSLGPVTPQSTVDSR